MSIKMSSKNNKDIFEINGLQFNFYWIFKYVWLCHTIIIDSTQHIYFYWSQSYIKTLSWTIFELLTPLKLHLMPCSLIVIHNEKSIAAVQFHHFVNFSVRVLKFHNLVEKRFYVRAWTKNFCGLICLKKKRSNRSNFKLYYGQYKVFFLPKIKKQMNIFGFRDHVEWIDKSKNNETTGFIVLFPHVCKKYKRIGNCR